MLTTLLFTLLSPAAAQDLTIHPDWLIEPATGTFYANGIGSPTVAYDEAQDLWVMYFETQFGPVEAGGDCRQGRWGIGRATSSDGLDWTVDADLVLEPAADSFYDCVVAHPTVVYDGSQWRMWFKAHQAATACDDGNTPSWGCGVVTGVGQAVSSDGINFTVVDEPIISLSTFGFPTVVQMDGDWHMLLAYSNAANQIYELWHSVSINGGDTWSTPVVVLAPGFAPWVEDEIYNPALTCDDDAASRYLLWAGGRDTTIKTGPPTVQTAGIGRAFSDDAIDWSWDGTSAIIEWNLSPEPPASPDRDWRHWDVVRVGDQSLLFFSERDSAGRNRVGVAYTYDSVQTGFDESQIGSRVCGTIPVDTGDTDPDPDTDTDTEDTLIDTDTDLPEDSDTDAGEPPDKDCSCDSSRTPFWFALLIPFALRRRRR